MSQVFKKPFWIKDIKVLVWDMDQTLYRDPAGLKEEFRRKLCQRLSHHLKISYKETQKKFESRKKQLKGTTITLNSFGLNGYRELVKIVKVINWRKFLKKDRRLREMFTALKNHRHLLLSDTTQEITSMKFRLLGLDLSIFEKLFCGLDLKITKPNIELFRKISEYTQLPPKMHLMIGNDVDKDILPAKKLGWHTCLVWKQSSHADISLRRVYEVLSLCQ